GGDPPASTEGSIVAAARVGHPVNCEGPWRGCSTGTTTREVSRFGWGLVVSLNFTWATTTWVPGVVGTFVCVLDVFGTRLPLSVKTTLLISRPWTVTGVPAGVVLPWPMVAVPLPTVGLLPRLPLPSAFLLP